jgi:formate C-acetyltransferase
MGAWERDVVSNLRWATAHWSLNQETKARWQPQVMRSLLIDDCIDNGREYNEGGARYNWAVVNVMGLANLVDSLAAIRQVVFDESAVTADELLEALEADFEGHEALRARLRACPKFGNGDPSVNDLAERVSEFVFRELLRQAPWRGGRFIPACLMFTTYAYFGKPVAATPDGRLAGEPIADSAGAYQGRDRSGPTCLLSSVSRIRHDLAPGTLVVNARFSRRYFDDPDQRRKLQELIQTYFELGGMQLQVNVVDQAVLQDAYAHPERHGDLIIRVGGYSEYWTRLDDDLRRAILERIEHE